MKTTKRHNLFFKIAFSLLIIFLMPGSSAFAMTIDSASQETDKGCVTAQDFITLKVIPTETAKMEYEEEEINSYSFETILSEMDMESVDLEYENKMEHIQNNDILRTVEVYEEDLAILTEYADILEKSYFTNDVPDFSSIYELSTQARQENMILMQAWAYQDSLINSPALSSCESKVDIKDVQTLDDGVREIFFRLEQNFERKDGRRNQFCGNWYFADIISTEEGSKIVNMWMANPAYEMMRDRVKNMLSARTSDNIMAVLKADILEEYEKNMLEMYS